MEYELINYLFENGFLDMNIVIKKYCNDKTLGITTFSLLKKIEESFKDEMKIKLRDDKLNNLI